AEHAEHRRGQRAEELQRAEDRQEQHGAGLRDDVPAEDDGLHLRGPRGQQVGRPLEAEAADAKGAEHQASPCARMALRYATATPSKVRCSSAARSNGTRSGRWDSTTRWSCPKIVRSKAWITSSGCSRL